MASRLRKIIQIFLDKCMEFQYNLLVTIVNLQRLAAVFRRPVVFVEGGNTMAEIRVKDNESIDIALRRFKRDCAREGILSEVRKREQYEKPSVRRKKKSEAARKRKFK